MSAEELAKQAADRVREVVAEAEKRAEEIVREAEAEAGKIRERAEAEAREKIERARKALAELAGDKDARETPSGETPTPPVPGPDPTPPAPDPAPPTPAPDPGPPPPEPGPQISANNSGGGDAAARLVAMKLAVDGKGREEIEAELDEKFGADDRSALLDDVLARAAQ